MNKYSLAAIVFLLSSFLFYPARAQWPAGHIAGQDFTYVLVDSIGGYYHYRFTLTIYADCLNGSPEAIAQDNPAYLVIYTGSGDEIVFDSVNYSSADTMSSPGTPCGDGESIMAPYCRIKKTFVYDYSLPLFNGGYIAEYQRCCWNNLSSLIDPIVCGTTATCTIPSSGIATHNNSAVFTNYPPFEIPVNTPIAFDCSATDADGDSLTYTLATDIDGDSLTYTSCVAFTGGGPGYPKPSPPTLFFSTEIFLFVAPMSFSNPVMCSVPLAIDPVTGLLTGTPDQAGTYFITVCCSEWRAGALVNTVKREFEYIVSDCSALGIPTQSASDMFMYPNPASTELTISASAGISAINITNLLGQTVYSNQYDAPEVHVNIAYLPSSLYFVKINDAVVRKFVKE